MCRSTKIRQILHFLMRINDDCGSWFSELYIYNSSPSLKVCTGWADESRSVLKYVQPKGIQSLVIFENVRHFSVRDNKSYPAVFYSFFFISRTYLFEPPQLKIYVKKEEAPAAKGKTFCSGCENRLNVYGMAM